MERVETTYARSGYLITLADGVRFLVRRGEADALGLPRVPGWSAKFKAAAVAEAEESGTAGP